MGAAGGREVFSTFSQGELPTGLGWRDDGTYPLVGPLRKQCAEHGTQQLVCNLAMKQLIVVTMALGL